MIDGIEILNQTIVQCPWYGWAALIFPVAPCIFGLIWFVLALLEKEFKLSIIGLAVFLAFAVGTYFCVQDNIKNFGYTQYQVKVSDSVSFNEFQNKYNIISQEGQIYTITEKTNRK